MHGRKRIIWRKNRTPSPGHPCARTRMWEPRNSWKSREFCREAEIRAVENALKLLRADDRRYKEAPSCMGELGTARLETVAGAHPRRPVRSNARC